MDPEVIVISDEEPDERPDERPDEKPDEIPDEIPDEMPNENDQYLGAIIISDEENSSDRMYQTSTPEVSLTSDEDESDHEPTTVIQKLSSSVKECSSENKVDHHVYVLKRKHEQMTKEFDTEQKNKKSTSEAETQNITRVRDMISHCKQILASSNKDSISILKGDCSKDVIYKYSRELNSDIESIDLTIPENTTSSASGDSDTEIKSDEVNDDEVSDDEVRDNEVSDDEVSDDEVSDDEVSDDENEKKCITISIDLTTNERDSGVKCDNFKEENVIIDDDNVPKNEKETCDQSDSSKQIINLTDANAVALNEKDSDDFSDGLKDKNITKSRKNSFDVIRCKYSSKESLFIETTDPEKEISTNIQTISSEKEGP